MSQVPDCLDHFIDGEWSAAADGATFTVADPVSNQPVHDVAFTGGAGPRLHHLGFFAYESHHVLRIRAAATSTATRSSRPGTPRRPQCSIWMASRVR